MTLKHQHAYKRGKNLEEWTYQQIKTHLGHNNQNHTNIIIPRPPQYKGKPYHEKTKIEIDNLFYHNGTLYIIQCKVRKGISKTGKTNHFHTTEQITNTLFFDKMPATHIFLDNLWKAKEYIKYHKLYKLYNPVRIKTILLIDSRLIVGKWPEHFVIVRGTYVITKQYFLNFLKIL